MTVDAPPPDRQPIVELIVDEHVAAFLESLYGLDWPQIIPAPDRSSTR